MPDKRPSTTFILVRHGQAADAHGMVSDESPLSQLGTRQADAVAAALAGVNAATLYCSPLLRAAATAKAIGRRLGIKEECDSRLREMHLSRETMQQMIESGVFPLWKSQHRSSPSGESLGDCAARVDSFLSDTVPTHGGRVAIVVSHGVILNQFLRRLLGWRAGSDWQGAFDLSYGSITEVEFWAEGISAEHAPSYAAVKRLGQPALVDAVTDS